jgi:hypothetical protein
MGSSTGAIGAIIFYSGNDLKCSTPAQSILAACHLVHDFNYREMKTVREIEILFRRLRLYDQLGRHAAGPFERFREQ